MDTLKMLEDISNAFGPSGFEDDVVAVARSYAPQGAALREDSLRNLYIHRPQDAGSAKPMVMLDAHTDEVGFMVQAIRPNGLLQLVPLGGWVGYTLPAHSLVVKNRDGQMISGIISTKPPHYLSEAERGAAPIVANMALDIGAASAAEVREDYGIEVGAPAAPSTCYSYNSTGNIMLGKAFDCRAGCACALAVMNEVYGETLPVAPVAALTAQEEVGTRGAQVAARTLAPAVAIVFEGCPADDTFAEEWKTQTALKKGPMLRHIDRGMITNPRFMRFMLDTADALGLPVQPAVRDGGGTNGAAIHLSGQGIPTVVVGLPVRYIHTHHSIAAKQDLDACIRLGTELVRRLTPEVIAGF